MVFLCDGPYLLYKMLWCGRFVYEKCFKKIGRIIGVLTWTSVQVCEQFLFLSGNVFKVKVQHEDLLKSHGSFCFMSRNFINASDLPTTVCDVSALPLANYSNPGFLL